MLNPDHIPLSLYIHVPWCVRKCPYCDFNSHAVPNGQLSLDLEQQYLHALLQDFTQQLNLVTHRPIHSIFIGGGTPSLISAQGYAWLFENIKKHIQFQDFDIKSADIEITLEANPATIEHEPFADYLTAGINRLSIGVQSFNPEHLHILGRIHSPEHAINAIYQAKNAGFKRLNVDLMHGLPQQNIAQALNDLEQAINAGATHLSWYQLTIEPNTVFYRTQPTLPVDDMLADIQQHGEQLLIANGFVQYEVSAWRKEQPSKHNLNYWQFGDYVAIGAGAHGKITLSDGIYRYQKTRLPKDYLAVSPAEQLQWRKIPQDELAFEFMMNALRLFDGINIELFSQRTGLELNSIQETVQYLQQKKLLDTDPHRIKCTALGQQYLNEVLQHFL